MPTQAYEHLSRPERYRLLLPHCPVEPVHSQVLGIGLASQATAKRPMTTVSSWPLDARCSSGVFKGRDVRQDSRMGLNPLRAQKRRYGARADYAHDGPELGRGLQQVMGCMHYVLALGGPRLAGFNAPFLLNCHDELAGGGLDRCS